MMSATTSATTGRRYGLERVCRTWERSRSALYARRARAQCRKWERSSSALYARRARAQCRKRGAGPARRGPTPALSDAQLLAAIRSDLTRSPFQGEGHRKVHARLRRVLDGMPQEECRVRKHVEESVATGAAAGRGRGGRFSAGRKREVVMRLRAGSCRGRWGSRRRGRRTGRLSFWLRGRRA